MILSTPITIANPYKEIGPPTNNIRVDSTGNVSFQGTAADSDFTNLTGDIRTLGTLQGRAKITADADGINLDDSYIGSIILMTGAGEVGFPDCDQDLIGGFITIWVRDVSEQVEVAMYGDTTNDLFVLSDGTNLDANDEADLTTAGNQKFCFMCAEINKWYVYSEDGTITDGGAAD